jgi:hypothetical protein
MQNLKFKKVFVLMIRMQQTALEFQLASIKVQVTISVNKMVQQRIAAP